jgi:hypothetical protein
LQSDDLAVAARVSPLHAVVAEIKAEQRALRERMQARFAALEAKLMGRGFGS